MFVEGDEFQGLGFGRAGFHADSATGTVFAVDLQTILKVALVLGVRLNGLEAFRLVGQIRRVDLLGADDGMRTGHYTLVTLNAVFRNPARNARSNAAFFQFGGRGRQGAVDRHFGNRHVVAFEQEYGFHHIFSEGSGRLVDERREFVGFGDFSRNSNLFDRGDGLIYCGPVHLDDVFTFFGVGFLDGAFDQLDGFLGFENAG